MLFLCKASTRIGLGHLVRSRTLAMGLKSLNFDSEIDFILIGDKDFDKLFLSADIKPVIIDSEKKLDLKMNYDVIFFDMMHLSSRVFNLTKKKAKLTVSLSPIFNHLKEVDILFNRTKYIDENNLPNNVYADLEYSIIQNDCKKISAGTFEENLKLSTFSIAISMGGGDAANRTFKLLKTLKKCKVPATFWVLLGEGYKHSYDKLINEIKSDTIHEIILVNTNKNMWQILRNCILFILPGGITSYESVYAGLPSINFLEDESNYFLIQELVESGVCSYCGVFNEKNMLNLNKKIEALYCDRSQLMEMHIKSKNLIKENSFLKIHDILLKKIKSQ
jgi:spore coat polysaccharide biosynthesis predicted glycosyltransferase SpsG